jgi:hypothetical protein
LYYLKTKDHTEYNGVESYIAQKLLAEVKNYLIRKLNIF